MIDVVAAALSAAACASPAAAALALVAGLFSSAGPCTASRVIAVTALTSGNDARKNRGVALAFVAGTVTAYVAGGLALRTVLQIGAHTAELNALCACALLFTGISGLAHTPRSSGCAGRRPGSCGAAFLLGALGALALSPCCAPLLTMLVVYASQAAGAWYAAFLLGAFAIGHGAPLVALACANGRLSSILARVHMDEAARTSGAILSGILGGYYLCIA